MICLFARIKKADFFKTQVANHVCSKYEKTRYPKANKAGNWFFKDSLKDKMDSNINNRIPGINNSLQLLKSSIPAL